MTQYPNEEKVTFVKSPGIVLENQIVEQIAGGIFSVYDKATKSFLALKPESLPLANVTYVPLKRLPWPSITEPEEYESEEQLYNDVKAFFIEHLDVRNELLFDAYAAATLASWRIEDWKVVPYLYFLGPLNSGKTRALECLQFLGYRPILASSLSSSALFRILEKWHCFMLLDESEIYNKESMIETLALLNAGYRRGQYAIRVEKFSETNLEVGFFDVFGIKAIAGTQTLAATLQSRCIPTGMSKAVKHVNLFIDEIKAQKLRNQLFMYRCRNLGEKQTFDISSLNGTFNNSRVIELFASLLQVAPSLQIRDSLIKLMEKLTTSQLDKEQTSIEAKLFECILQCVPEEGKVSTKAIAEKFNGGRLETEKWKTASVGRKVTALGFEPCRIGSTGRSGYYWDTDLIERLRLRYAFESPSVPPVPSVPSVSKEKGLTPYIGSTEGTEGSPSTLIEVKPKDSIHTEGTEQTEQTEGLLEVSSEADKAFKTLAYLTGTYPQGKLENKIMELGYSQPHAKRIFDYWNLNGIIRHDDIDNWYFVRGPSKLDLALGRDASHPNNQGGS